MAWSHHHAAQPSDYDFRGESYKSFFPNLHRYPATMLPQIGVKLMAEFGVRGRIALDPFCGSGSSFIAMILAGFTEIHGFDRNGFATLLSRARYRKYDFDQLVRDCSRISTYAADCQLRDDGTPWLPSGIWAKAQKIRDEIRLNYGDASGDFLLVALAEALRKSSYTRQGEFKLYRIPAAERAQYRPDFAAIFAGLLP
ncbi:MAG: hypothetical protein ORN98_08680, partial [Alphaproteobacteria bacterium]|nr:hypothetical protein [Alphaproteobacteria bacterium]